MQYVDEFRDPELAKALLAQIRETISQWPHPIKRPLQIMEVLNRAVNRQYEYHSHDGAHQALSHYVPVLALHHQKYRKSRQDQAKLRGLKNFSLFCQHITIVPTLRCLLEQDDVRIDGFICTTFTKEWAIGRFASSC